MCMCGHLFRPLGADERIECLRHEDHQGEHMGKDDQDRYVVWWTDLACDCEDCQSDDPYDWCKMYTTPRRRVAERLLRSRQLRLYAPKTAAR